MKFRDMLEKYGLCPGDVVEYVAPTSQGGNEHLDELIGTKGVVMVVHIGKEDEDPIVGVMPYDGTDTLPEPEEWEMSYWQMSALRPDGRSFDLSDGYSFGERDAVRVGAEEVSERIAREMFAVLSGGGTDSEETIQ